MKVCVAMRRQRYVLQKLLAGVPTDHVAFTRFAAQAGKVLPPEAIAAGMKQMILQSCGSPEQFGAPKPDDNVFAAGLTQSQNYLALVAEGRIRSRPWLEVVDGQTVHFADRSSEAFDAVILGNRFQAHAAVRQRDDRGQPLVSTAPTSTCTTTHAPSQSGWSRLHRPLSPWSARISRCSNCRRVG